MVAVTGRRPRPAGARRAATAVLAALSALAVLAAGACGAVRPAQDSIVGKDGLVIGVHRDQPGLGLQLDGTEPGHYDSYEGFDIRIAKEIARLLRVNASKVRFRAVTSEAREEMLQDGDIDFVVGTYSITPERKTKMKFAGPYYVAHQDILVPRSNPHSIRGLRDLAGKRLCAVPGSQSFHRVRTEQGVPAVPVEAGGYGDCLDLLVAGRLDAVSTDDLILAGLASKAAETGAYMRLVNAPFTDERYGVGIRDGDVDGCEAINEAITKMYQSGLMRAQLNRWFGPAGLDLTTTVPQFEGCI